MTIIVFLAVLIVLILVHEFGHFIVAKKSGIRVDEFGVGFPPKVFGKKYGETEYTLNWLPIGGFVRIWGEDPSEEHFDGLDSERSFVKQPRYIQAAVLIAGVTMNVLLAFVLYVITFATGMPTAIDESEGANRVLNATVYVGSVFPNTPAADALKPSDTILNIHAGNDVLTDTDSKYPSRIVGFISGHENIPVTIEVLRRGEPQTVTVTPTKNIIPDDPERAAAGFSMTLISIDSLPISQAVTSAASRTYTVLGEIIKGLGVFLTQAVRGNADYTQVTGPVGMVGMVGDAAAMGFTWLMTFTALISLNLAVINLLPVPALDGGRLVFVLIESVIRRPIKPVIARRMNQIGFIALLALMALVTVHDIIRVLG